MSDRSKRVWRSAGRVVGLLAGLLAAIYVGLWVVGLPLVNVASLYEAREMTAGQPSLRLQFEALPGYGTRGPERRGCGDGSGVQHEVSVEDGGDAAGFQARIVDLV